LQPVLASQRASEGVSCLLIAGPRLLGALAVADWRGSLAEADRAAIGDWYALASSKRVASAPPLASPLVTDRVASTMDPPASDLTTPLSPRELEVLVRMAAGDSNKQIARALDLSPHTVKRHVANILDKLGLASRGQASAWYLNRQAPSAKSHPIDTRLTYPEARSDA
jgi:LuxR family transcriptional regulator, maltose regulon positive regulatory protein